MAKDEFIGIRVTKEFKKFIQREAKRKGISLSEYIEGFHADDNFKLTRKHFQSLLERAKEDLPSFWKVAGKSRITKEFEELIPLMVSDFLNPMNRTNPGLHPAFILHCIPLFLRNTIVHIDSIDDEYRLQAVEEFLSSARIVAENLNKLKVGNKEEQKHIVSELKNIIESFVFYFTSMAFAKDSFVAIKKELDKTEKILLDEINKAGKPG